MEKEKKSSIAFAFLMCAIALCVNIKTCLCDFDADAAYSVAMSYRHISGDRLFFEMWEPNQTAIYMLDLFVLIWKLFVPGLNGVALWLQICGMLFYAGISIKVFLTLKKHLPCELLISICTMIFVFRPKSTNILEYTNLLYACAVLTFAFLCDYFLNGKRNINLVLSGIFTAAGVLAYPSSVFVAMAVVFLIVLIDEKKARSVLSFTGTCIALAILYLLVVLRGKEISDFIDCIKCIFFGDSHSEYRYSGFIYFREILWGVVLSAVVAVLAYASTYLWNKLFAKKISYVFTFVTANLLAFSLFSVYFYKRTPGGGFANKAFYWNGFAVLLVIGAILVKACDRICKKVYLIGLVISGATFAAAVTFSNLPIIASVPYASLGIIISLIPIYFFLSEKKYLWGFKTMAAGIILLMAFNRFFFVSSTSFVDCIFELDGIVKEGPEAGIFNHGAYRTRLNDSRDLFDANISEDDVVLIVEGFRIDPAFYLYTKATNGASSTISTPTYNDVRYDYWEKNPDHYPTIIVVPVWFGTELHTADDWAYDFINENFILAAKTEYWNFYRQKIEE